jgi:hypothetical protein
MQRNVDELALPGRATTTLTCTSPHFLPSKEISRADLALVSQRLAAVRLIACVAIETQRKNAAAIHMPARSPHAELPCGRLDRQGGLAACWLDTSITKTSLPAPATNSATSLKQAVLGHLREF